MLPNERTQRHRPEIPPTISFSLAAIVRIHSPSQDDVFSNPQYVLVHEKPPRGWWLPGGGIEHHDSTPVDAAVRETVEEAAAKCIDDLGEEQRPKIGRLLSLQQTPGRLRFIFRGEWLDESGSDVLKVPPGDGESIEAKWVQLSEVKSLPLYKHKQQARTLLAGEWADPWLRGHEPLTYFEMLESSWMRDRSIPGLPVKLYTEKNSGDANVIGAFFKRIGQQVDNCRKSNLQYRKRDALVTHLNARLIVYDDTKQRFAVDHTNYQFPSNFVHNQYAQTLKQLVHTMVMDFIPDSNANRATLNGILRIEYTIDEATMDATLTVFPYLIISSEYPTTSFRNKQVLWVPVDELRDEFEGQLANAVLDPHTKFGDIDILADSEG